MKSFISKLPAYAPVVLRYGFSAVILWFSSQQFLHNSYWIAYIPDYAVSLTHISASTLVTLNATFELIFGLMLLIGWQTRLAALLLSLHIFDIMFVVGYSEIGVRDFGLAIALLTIFMDGPDQYCIDSRKEPTATTN